MANTGGYQIKTLLDSSISLRSLTGKKHGCSVGTNCLKFPRCGWRARRRGTRYRRWSLRLYTLPFPSAVGCAEHGGKVIGTEMVDGRSVVVAETTPVENDGSWKARYWVDQGHNSTVVRRAGLTKRSGETDWKIYTQTDSRNYQEFGDGIWLPTEVVVEVLNTQPGDEPSTIAWRVRSHLAPLDGQSEPANCDISSDDPSRGLGNRPSQARESFLSTICRPQ